MVWIWQRRNANITHYYQIRCGFKQLLNKNSGTWQTDRSISDGNCHGIQRGAIIEIVARNGSMIYRTTQITSIGL